MGKKIVIFSDGTGNSSAKAQKTNVWRTYKALDLSDSTKQIAFYDDGVGTSSFAPLAALGGAFGYGLARNVKEIYGFVCRTYQPGDEISGFGFSRGAFTMRVVAALICQQGIIKIDSARDEQDRQRLIRAAYRRFRSESFDTSGLARIFRPIRNKLIQWKNAWQKNTGYDPKHNHPGRIKFLGVWDTVDAYGLSIDEMTRAWDRVVWPLSAKDRELSGAVDYACHALALDERRQSFEPMLWNEEEKLWNINKQQQYQITPIQRALPPGEYPGRPVNQFIDDERIQQVWFAGVHSNVGGGYPDDSLSHVPLRWIMDQSVHRAGLQYLPRERKRLSEAANSMGPIYDSRRGVGTFYRYKPRNLDKLCNDQKPNLFNLIKFGFNLIKCWLERVEPAPAEWGVHMNPVKIDWPMIHHSVFERIAHGGDGYAPYNLPRHYLVVQADGSVNRGPEDPDQAETRRQGQELVWNKVWLRRFVYGLTLLSTLGLVVFPSLVPKRKSHEGISGQIKDLSDTLDGVFGTLVSAIRSLPELVGNLPGLGFAKGLFDKYVEYPYIFCIFVITIGVLILYSGSLRQKIWDEMRGLWGHIGRTSARRLAKSTDFRISLANLRNHTFYAKGITGFWRFLAEVATGFVFVVLIISIASRISFIAIDGFGGVCAATPGQLTALNGNPAGRQSVTFKFPANDPCFATGIELKKNTYYWLEMALENGWKDGSDPGILADARGWFDPPGVMSLFTLLRRHLLADWYQPIARIGDTKFDRYPLLADSARPETTTRGQMCLRHKFEARDTGELFLYLNDAVLFTPDLSVMEFYSNNQKSAKMRVASTDEYSPQPDAPLCERAVEPPATTGVTDISSIRLINNDLESAAIKISTYQPILWSTFLDADKNLVIEIPNAGFTGSLNINRGAGLIESVLVKAKYESDQTFTYLVVHSEQNVEVNNYRTNDFANELIIELSLINRPVARTKI